MDKNEILEKFKITLKENKPLIGVSVGSGLSSKLALQGGADFILVLSAGKFRNSGLASIACMMPYSNSNELVIKLAEREILPQIREIPVIFGACASDPKYSIDELLTYIKKAGFHGVNNFPTVGLIDGLFREKLEEEEMGFNLEIELMKKAVAMDLFTVAFVFNEEEAEQMAKAGVDVICAHLGWTPSPDNIISKSSLKKYTKTAEDIFNAINKVDKNIIKMIYGGPVSNPEQTDFFYENTQTMGYIGGTSFEKVPEDVGIKSTTNLFKNYHNLHWKNQSSRKEVLEKIGAYEIIGESKAIEIMFGNIHKIINKHLNLVITGQSGTGKDAVAKYILYNEKGSTNFNKIDCSFFGREQIEELLCNDVVLAHPESLNLELQYEILKKIKLLKLEKKPIRILTTTSKDLYKMVVDEMFLEDLYYELCNVEIRVPSISERKEDIPILIKVFINIFEKEFDFRKKLKITPEVIELLIEFQYSGNVRELKHAIKRAVILSDKYYIRMDSLPSYIRDFGKEEKPNPKLYLNLEEEEIMDSSEKYIIETVLEKNNWNKTLSAKQLGISRKTLYNKIKQYNLHKN